MSDSLPLDKTASEMHEPGKKRGERNWNILGVLVGFLTPFSISLVGKMPLSEILLLALAGFVVLGAILNQRIPGPVAAPRLLALFLGCQIIALAGYVVSDFYRNSLPLDMIRGWSRMVFLALDIYFIGLIFGKSENAYLGVQIGAVFAGVQCLFVRPLFGDYWKFGFGFPLTLAVLLLGPRLFGYWGALAALVLMAFLHVIFDFRSMAGECILMIGLLLLRMLKPPVRKMVFVGGVLLGLAIFPWFISQVLSSDSSRATRSNVERTAMLQAAWEGFLKSPILGNGSWFSQTNVMDEFLVIRSTNAQLAGVGGFADDDFEGLAIHSQILVSLAEGGLFGGTFFFAYGIMLAWAIQYCILSSPWNWLLPIKLFSLLIATFNLLMSPFSGGHRVDIAVATGLILLYWNERNRFKSKPQSPRNFSFK